MEYKSEKQRKLSDKASEKLSDKQASLDYYSANSSPLGQSSTHHYSLGYRIVDSFKRDPNANISFDAVDGGRRVFNANLAAAATASSPLSRSLEARHLQMIAIGGSIGTGLFVGSGAALATGGPASLLIAFSLIGIMLYCTVQSLGEMAVLYPVAGSFSAYSTRFLDPAWGFAMGWNYALQWLVTLPLEIVAACFTIDYWNQGRINNDAWVIIFLVLIVSINFFGVKGYGEAEFVFSILKVIAVIGFIILGVVLVIGGSTDGGSVGGQYWVDPGAFHNGFKGLCSVFVTAAFAFGGTELVGLAAAETANPRKSLPAAFKQVFWRITIFYMFSLTLVGLLVPYTEPRLLDGISSADSKASPFTIAINSAGIAILPSVFNAVILVAVISVGNSAVFGSSRTIAALADQGQAPRIFGYIDRQGRPIVAILLASSLGFLAFLAGSDKQQAAFDWMIALSGLSSIFTWGSICLAHIRFRKAWAAQGHTVDELAYRSQAGVVGSWVGLILNILVTIAQFWTGLAPIGYDSMTSSERAQTFFQGYLAAPVALVCYISYKLYFRTKIMRTHEMDLQTGIRELDISELIAEERAEHALWSRPKKIYKFFC